MSEQWPSKEQEIWFQAGVSGERERIIKIITEQIETFDCDVCGECITQERFIELIKGEN